MTHIQTTRDDHRIAWLSALAISIHLLESALPSPIAGVKPGLANVVTLVVLFQFGWRLALWVHVLRVLVGSLLLGTFLSPTFFLSLSGAVASIVILLSMHSLARIIPLSPIGYSIPAALAHMYAQFWVAYFLFIQHEALFNLLPIFMTAALVFGLVTGVCAQFVLAQLQVAPVAKNQE